MSINFGPMFRNLGRLLKTARRWWRSGQPIPFFFPAARQRANLMFQEKKNLQNWTFAPDFLSLEGTKAYIFMHIPKTAGTFVANKLHEDAGFSWLDPTKPPTTNRIMIPHYSLDWLIESKILSQDFVSNARVFSIVRHPYERALSAYKYLIRMGAVPKKWPIKKFMQYLCQENPRIGGGRVARLSHAAPQTRWLLQHRWPHATSTFKLDELSGLGQWINSELGTQLDLSYRKNPESNPRTLAKNELTLIDRWARTDFEYLNFKKFGP
jgi:hypothetical protein